MTPDGRCAVLSTDRYLRHIGYQNCSYIEEKTSGKTGSIKPATLGGKEWAKLEDEFDRFIALEKQKARDQGLIEGAANEAAKFATRADTAINLLRGFGLADDAIEKVKIVLSGAIQPARVAN